MAASTLTPRAKVSENILERLRQLETTVNGEPHEEDEKISHPFTPEVIAVPMPDKFKIPQIPLIPNDHLNRYDSNLFGIPGEIACMAFNSTLADSTREWFGKLKPNSIASWNDVKKAFRAQYIGVKKMSTPKERLKNVHVPGPGPNETLKDWLAR